MRTGPPGCGKTSIAAKIALGSEFPYMKLISPDNMIGYSEREKVEEISKCFEDAYKSPLSLIILDNIERLLGMRVFLWLSLFCRSHYSFISFGLSAAHTRSAV